MRIPSTLLIAICTIITSIGNVFAAQVDPILAHAMPIVRTADGDTVPCFSIKIQPVILNGQTGPYCPTYGNLTLAAVDSATGNRIPGLTYSWSGLSVNTLSDSALTWLIIVPEWCDTVYYPTVTVSDGHGCVKTVTDTVEVRSSGPQFIGNLPDIDVSPQSGGGYMIPDFKSLISNTIVTSICYPFYAIKYSDAYGTVERADWYSQEPAAGAVFTEDSVAVVITITDPCGVSNSTTVNVLRSDANPDTSVVIDGISCPAAPMVTDHEGNIYATVQIGNQCWMRDNLRTTTSPSTGTYLIPAANVGDTYTGKQARWYNNDSATYAPMNYGLLYNWNAAVDTFNTEFGETSVNSTGSNAVSVSFTGHRRGICPAGWHLPSDTEWNTMEATVSGSDWWWTIYETFSGGRGSHAGKLAGGDDWTTSSTSGAPGDYSNAERNVSGFSALPAGECYGTFIGSAGVIAIFWSSSQLESDSSNAWSRFLLYYNEPVIRSNKYKYYGCSVRCLRDEVNTSSLPTVTTGPVTSVTSTSATCGGEVTSDGGATVTARGVCWSTSPNPTVADSHTSDGNGMGSFNSYISGLIPNTTYYVRAYATNQYGTVYGEELSFTTPCPVISINGPSYIHLFGEITLMASGGDNYVWNTGDSSSTITITVTPNGTVTYSVTGTDDYGCIGSTSKVVTTYPSINPTEAGTGLTDIEVDCNNPSVTLCANVIAKTTTDYTVESIPFNPPFDFTEGTRRGLDFDGIDDRWGSSTNLPFCFSYYGWNYTHIVPGSNSVASFGYHSGECNWRFSDSIPSSNLFTNTIFACYRDIDTRYFGTNGGVFDSVYGEWPNRCYKLSFNNIGLFNDNAHSPTFSSMIVLYEGTNIIEIYLRDAPTNTSWNNGNGVLGLQNSTGTKGITPPGRNTGPWTAHEEAWRFIPVADSNYTVTWYLGTDTTLTTGIIVGTGDTITVFPQESTDYTARLQHTDDCGRTFTIAQTCHVTVNRGGPIVTVNASQNELCEGDNTTLTATGADTYLWSTGDEGSSITVYPTTTTTYYVTGYSGAECSSIDSITVTVWESVDSVITVTACDSYTWNDTIYYISGEYVQHFQTVHGCDSTVTLHLTVNHSTDIVLEATVMENDLPYSFNGHPYYESGTYTDTMLTVNGCDSIIYTHLVVLPNVQTEIDSTICDNMLPFFWNGNYCVQSGDYTHILTTVYGADSIVTLHLTVNPANHTNLYQTACDSYTWRGETYTESGDYPLYLTNTAGCDSIVTLHLTINHSDTVEFSAIACNNYNWNGITYTESGDYKTYMTNASGCNLVLVLHLTVNHSDTTDLYASACDSYFWNGTTYYVSGNYAHTFMNAAGCDSVVTLHLTIHHSYDRTLFDTVLENNLPYFINGLSLFETGMYIDTMLTVNYCDSIVTLYLTVLHNVQTEIDSTICSSQLPFIWNDSIYMRSGDYIQQLSTVLGSDSIVTLHLTVLLSDTTEFSQICCYNYTWNGINYSEAGDYFQTLINQYGCDSLVIMHLTVYDTVFHHFTIEACDQYIWNDIIYTTSGDYTQTFVAATGCDSIVTLHLTINPIPVVAITGNTIICPGGGTILTATGADNYLWSNGSTNSFIPVNQFGIYRVTGTSATGCANTDSITVLVAQPPAITISGITDLCVGDTSIITVHGGTSYLWDNGSTDSVMTVSDAGIWQVIGYDENGCNSMTSVNVNVWQPTVSEFSVFCPDSCHIWNYQTYCESGDYTQTLQTVHGCDSVVTLHLTITVGVDDYEIVDFKVYPNPTNNFVNVQCTMNNVQLEEVEIQVVDIYGKLVRAVETLRATSLQRIDISDLASGVYFVKAVADGKTIAVRKVVKQ